MTISFDRYCESRGYSLLPHQRHLFDYIENTQFVRALAKRNVGVTTALNLAALFYALHDKQVYMFTNSYERSRMITEFLRKHDGLWAENIKVLNLTNADGLRGLPQPDVAIFDHIQNLAFHYDDVYRTFRLDSDKVKKVLIEALEMPVVYTPFTLHQALRDAPILFL